MGNVKRKSYLLIFLAGFFWGITGLFFRYLEGRGIAPMEVVLLRMGFAALILGVYLAVKDRRAFCFRLKDLWCLAGAGGACLLMFASYFKAMTYTTLAVAGVLLYTAPGFVVVFSAVLFKERITVQKIFALILLFGGCVCCGGVIGGSHTLTMQGLLIGVTSGVAYSLYTVFSRYSTLRGYSAYTITFYAMAIGALGALFLVDLPALAGKMTAAVWGLGIGIGFFCCVLPYLLYTAGMQKIENGEAAMLATSEPLVAALFSVVWFGETMTAFTVLGVMLMVMGICAMNMELSRRRERP